MNVYLLGNIPCASPHADRNILTSHVAQALDPWGLRCVCVCVSGGGGGGVSQTILYIFCGSGGRISSTIRREENCITSAKNGQ